MERSVFINEVSVDSRDYFLAVVDKRRSLSDIHLGGNTLFLHDYFARDVLAGLALGRQRYCRDRRTRSDVSHETEVFIIDDAVFVFNGRSVAFNIIKILYRAVDAVRRHIPFCNADVFVVALLFDRKFYIIVKYPVGHVFFRESRQYLFNRYICTSVFGSGKRHERSGVIRIYRYLNYRMNNDFIFTINHNSAPFNSLFTALYID